MNKLNFVTLFIVFVFCISTQKAKAQLSKTHYIPPLTNAGSGNANPENQYLYLSTPSNAAVFYTIKPIGLPTTSYITGTISSINPVTINLGNGYGQLFVASNQTSTIAEKGYVIEADGVIYASVRMQAGSSAQAGALVSKGASALGTEFRVGSFTNQNPQDNYLNFVSVMATEDNTQVEFSNLPAGLVIKNYSGTTPVNITLNKHQSYTIATNSLETVVNRDGLIGCLVSANKPIVVNCGSTNGSFHNGGGRDYGLDQIVGASKIGNEYIFVKGDGSNNWENVLIVAHTDNTTISINGNASITTINAGEYYLIEGDNYNAIGNMFVQTSNNVFAYQGIGATTSEANQGLFFVPPLSCEARGNLDNIANIEQIGSTVYSGGITIVTKATATVTINNLPLSNFTTNGPNTVSGNLDYVTYKITGLTGNVSVQSNDELYCAYFNFNGAATSGSFYSGFPSPPEINFDLDFETLGNCIPNITLTAQNTQNFDSYEWLFNSGSGFVTFANGTPNISPTIAGTYKLVGVVTCSGLTLESPEVPISICPDDRDGDGIIDNIDIDNDNDGILNCTESNGDVVLNLSNINQPELMFQNGSTNSVLATGNYTQTSNSGVLNTFTATTNGEFISTLNADNISENQYNLAFSEPVNINFSENINQTHTITDGEYFVAKILPINKNITLLDPDNRLLVDSNFDGVFETGVTQISSSEIRFKINPTPTGTAPYQFLAHAISGFTFVHHLANVSENATFSGVISLTCYQLDSDLDGIENAYDLDSDNDGIPDFIEALGNNWLPVSGTTNLNGLDTIYSNGSIPIDTDQDGVLDYLDLDSDNDGIHDLHETGQLGVLSDTDTNGIVDGNALDFGENGWINYAETTPESGVLGFVLNDFDADNNYSYLDFDSDDDGCSDVIEAGFTDENQDNFLGNTTVNVNLFGIVTNALDGYTIPNNNYLDTAVLTIETQPINTSVCQDSNTTIFLSSATTENYQWQSSTDAVNWTTLTNNTNFNNTNTNQLTITNTPLSFNNTRYRVVLSRSGNSCNLFSNEVVLTVNPLPQVITPVTLVQCDDDNDGFSAFNLTEANSAITNITNNTFTYFLTQAAALNGDTTSTDFINNPTTYTNATVSNATVWAHVRSAFGCTAVAQIQLQVSTTAIPNSFQQYFSVCDDFLDINGNNNANNNSIDGVSTFNFSSVTAQVLALIPAGQNPLPPKYYRNLEDALAEENQITDTANYRNIGYPNTQQIYIRIDSNVVNDCLGLGAHITLTVEQLPAVNTVNITPQCTNNSNGTYPFNVAQLEANVLNGQSPTNVTVTYFDQAGNALPSPLPNPFVTQSQTITISVTNNQTEDPNGPCYAETMVNFIVNTTPVANPINVFQVCDDDENDTDGIYSFDTSNIQNQIIQEQTNVQVLYFDGLGNALSSPLPNPFITNTQTITATIVNITNTNCVDSTNIEFIVNTLPDFQINSEALVCTSDPTFTVLLDPIEANVTENYTYQWTYQDGTVLSNQPTLTTGIPGTYTITLTKTDGSGCFKSQSMFVDASEIATITHADVVVQEFSTNNTITIITENNNLGLGSYEFSLNNEFFNYQDAPIFTNVSPGFHTIYVRDKKGCGTTTLEIAILGYPKFFTPNNDTFNDTWQLIGANRTNTPDKIYIYNRFGKLITILNASQNKWNGTYNGQQLPTSDYWFTLVLQNGKKYSGHFTLKR